MRDFDGDALEFEREKWRSEMNLRGRELDLKELEQATRDAEIDLKRKEQASSKWRSPLIVAILAAAVAAAGNAVVTYVNGRLQRDMDARRHDAEIQLEKNKSESDRILEMIKTGDPEKAAGNLEFLVKSGLVTNPELTARLKDFLENRTPGSGPSLPSPSSRVGFDESSPITPSMQQDLQKLLNDYFTYLDKAGFPRVAAKATIKIENMRNPGAYYRNDTIFIDARMAGDPTVALREYNHHVLTERYRDQDWINQYSAIESGLADYFACSYLNNPKIGEKTAQVFALKPSFMRTLANNRKFAEFSGLTKGQIPDIGAEIWGGAFWEIRDKLGRNAADAIMASAWFKHSVPNEASAQASEFVKALLTESRTKGQTELSLVERVLRTRGFPVS